MVYKTLHRKLQKTINWSTRTQLKDGGKLMYFRRRSKHFQLSRLVFIMNLIYTFSTSSSHAFKVWTNHIYQKQNVGKQNFRIYQPIMLYSICSFVRYFLKGILCYINDSICSCTWKQLILYVKLYVSKIY